MEDTIEQLEAKLAEIHGRLEIARNQRDDKLFDLPSPEQLEHFRTFSSDLRRDMDEPHQEEGEEDSFYKFSQEEKDVFNKVGQENKEAFRDLILGLAPDVAESWEITWVQKEFPIDWYQYCKWNWGTPEELRDMEEERLLREGWIRGADGEVYLPWDF